ncbi:ATP-binding protein [Candidatus Pacearchaeota archaeon]|nr:ATP-binding protein [Candidatus Pacearchaeota archaeon]
MQKRAKSESPGKARLIVINFIRLILILGFLGGIYYNRKLVLIMSVSAFVLTFAPAIIQRIFKTKLPASFEVIVLFFIYGILFIGNIRGLFAEFWWWDILLNLLGATILGLIALAVLYTLQKEKVINASPYVVSIFSFCFAVAFGAIWELFEFGMDIIVGFNLQKSAVDTMEDLGVTVLGAFFVSLAGYYYIKNGKINVMSKFVTNVVNKYPKFFKSKENPENNKEEILSILKKGENHKLEFKSTLRKNLHTNEYDKKIEHSVLKTVNAYLNSDGGTLLVGVSNNGEVTGIEQDDFPDNDKLNLYFTNLLKQHIGSEFLPYIKYDIINLNGKHVLKIDCAPCNKHVFLKTGQEEEFYIRNGPSSARLSGSALIDYINNKFMNK